MDADPRRCEFEPMTGSGPMFPAEQDVVVYESWKRCRVHRNPVIGLGVLPGNLKDDADMKLAALELAARSVTGTILKNGGRCTPPPKPLPWWRRLFQLKHGR